MRKLARITTTAVASATAVAAVASGASGAVPTDTSDLRDAVTAEGILEHLEAFQDIADANDGTRASGTGGYDDSADYVADLLEDAGYSVTRQQFTYQQFLETADPVLDLISPDLAPYVPNQDFFTMEYSGSDDVTAEVTPVDVQIPPGSSANSSTSGCEASDFDGFTAGNIALMQRGTCAFRVKVDNAAAAGATGAIIFNEGQEGRTDAFLGTLSPPQAAIPAVGSSFAVGEEIYNLTQEGPVTARLAVSAEVRLSTTENVLAETTEGRDDRTVITGGHLDSVLEGPGIQDNGSGTGAVLETALQMAELGVEPTNRVRFAFWGAEEAGLIGSTVYVNSLSAREIKDIALYLNFDMIASPNYVRFVYDGDGSAFGIRGPAGSHNIERVFTEFFDSQGLPSEPTAFDGRSDYLAFINAGIPAGGLFTGAEVLKTEEQAAIYGGVAGAQFDPCYHLACDSLTPVADGADAALYDELSDSYDLEGNVNMDALEEMSDAVAHATLEFAMTTADASGAGQASDTATKATAEADHMGPFLQR